MNTFTQTVLREALQSLQGELQRTEHQVENTRRDLDRLDARWRDLRRQIDDIRESLGALPGMLPLDPKNVAEIARFMLATREFLEAEGGLRAFCKRAK